MDCPSEENLIRIKLGEFGSVKSLDFDLSKRVLTVYHDDDTEAITSAIEALNLNGKLVDSVPTVDFHTQDRSGQTKLLWIVLWINFAFFLIEMSTGILSRSMGLVADSLDMLADAFVYGISLLAVGRSVIRKKQVASLAGYFQMVLAILGFFEVIRRFLAGIQLPDFNTMIFVSAFALVANGICLYLLNKSSSKDEAHMKASVIFTSNDIIINMGVILAGILVLWTHSGIPDLLIGSIVFILVVRGATRILTLGK